MKCGRCKFENIPGEKRCIKCGCVLEIELTGVILPRMSKWKKPFRNLPRLMRKVKILLQNEINSHLPGRVKGFLEFSLVGMLLSVVPGLGHLLQNRFKQVLCYFFLWLTLILLGLLLYGGLAGYICVGFAVGVHSGIALNCGILKILPGRVEKISAIIFVLAGLTALYRFVPRVFFPEIVGGYSSLTIAGHNVEAGDYLLARRGLKHQSFLPRGSLVLIRAANYSSYRLRPTRLSKDKMIGEIVGVGGDDVRVSDGVYIVNGRVLDEKRYPVPQWLQAVNISVKVPKDSYFVSVGYNVKADGLKLDAYHIRRLCLVKAADVEAKAFMLWWPLSRRGSVK